jgi:uncharacterized protein (TIGR02270 family)
MVGAPHIRLGRLVEIDERLDSHVAALSLSGSHAWVGLEDLLEGGDAHAFEVAASLALASADPALWTSLLDERAAAFPPEDVLRGAVAALARAGRSEARQRIDELVASPDALHRAIGAAAIGARRIDIPEEILERLAEDPDPLPRARAWRSIGQLGRRTLMPQLLAASAEEDPECRFWGAWSAARMGETATFRILADIARGTGPRADAALEILLRRATREQGNAWFSSFAGKYPDRRRSVVRATGILGDPIYMPWLLDCMQEPDLARIAGDAAATITGLDIAYLDLDRDVPEGFEAGPNDNADDDDVALDEDEWLPWPDMQKLSTWWRSNGSRFPAGTAFFLGRPKASADWLGALSDGFQHQRRAAALELAIRQPDKPMFEARARGRQQRRQLVGAMGEVSSGRSSGPS